MRGCGVAENDWSASEKSVGKYLLCVGGYPLAKLPSFTAAAEAAQERMSDLFELNDDFSIYEIETGIHFEVPRGSRFDGGQPPEAFELLFSGGLQTNDYPDIFAHFAERVVNPIDRVVGGAIRSRRLQLNLTSAQVAKAANIQNFAFDDYEAGRTRPQAEHLRRIAATLEVPLAFFFGWLFRH